MHILEGTFFSRFTVALFYISIGILKVKYHQLINIIENIIGGLATKYEKRKYRTELGFFNHILTRINYRGQI